MQWISLAIFALLTAAIIVLFRLKFNDLWTMLSSRKKSTLKDSLDVVTGTPQKGFFNKEFYEVEQILKATGREGKFELIKRLTVVFFAAGVVLAILLDNMFLIPVFGLGLAMTPVWYIRSTASTYKRRLNEQLETALSIVTTSYLRTEDIIRSVKENLPYMTDPVKGHFASFVTESELINANTVSALNTLKMKVPNRIFHEWVNTVIQCQSDRNMKNILISIVQKFSDVRVVQAELDTMIAAPRKEAVGMMFLVIANVPLLYLLNKDWFHALIYTTQGKIALAICAAIILFSFARIIKLSKPIEYRG